MNNRIRLQVYEAGLEKCKEGDEIMAVLHANIAAACIKLEKYHVLVRLYQ